MMAEEWFDVVDEKDRVIRQATRQEVHRHKWLHRAVHTLVFNQDNKLFLQKRALNKDSHPGKWDSSSSGHLDAGEDYESAARRELMEELGISVSPESLELLTYLPASDATDQEFIKIFRTTHEGPFKLHSEEISEGQFFEISQIQNWIQEKPEDFATAFRTLFTVCFSKNK